MDTRIRPHFPGLRSSAPGLKTTAKKQIESEPKLGRLEDSTDPVERSGTGRAIALGLVGLSGVLLAGCQSAPGIESPDIVLRTNRRAYNSDHFWQDGDNSISSSFGQQTITETAPSRFEDPHSENISPAGSHLGSINAEDNSRMDELFQVRDAHGRILLHTEEVEVDRGFFNRTHSEVLSGSFQGQPIIRIVELEESKFFNGAAARDIETLHYLENGQDRAVGRVEERIYGGEHHRLGTTIDVDYRGEPLKVETDAGYAGFLSRWVGSRVRVNGEHTYDVNVKYSGGGFGQVFTGYTIRRADGTKVAELDVNREFTRYQDAYDVRVNGELQGTIFLENNSYQPTDSEGDSVGPEVVRRKTFVRFAGQTDAEKLENLDQINLVLALMPDQVNYDHHSLELMEEGLDVAQFLITNSGKTQADEVVREQAIAVSTEEDAMSVGRALEEIVHNRELGQSEGPRANDGRETVEYGLRDGEMEKLTNF